MQTWRVTGARPCLEDETLLALARGELLASQLPQAEEHLQGCADCRAVLAEAARTLNEEPETGDTPLTHIARYEVVALLGAGASGVVYRGFDPRLKRPVALKLLHPEQQGASPRQAERLLREAQAMARLSDPHVVAVYDTGIHEGHVFLVMEYVDGITLSEWLGARAHRVRHSARLRRRRARALRGARQRPDPPRLQASQRAGRARRPRSRHRLRPG
jgi:eukaryotic-like serine/threonine-protein kinase